ncbi:MAG: universal stress protein [Candidatus Bathyarchaeia archaeon]|jgi:nucleotide-binding universal stress UspA family protein
MISKILVALDGSPHSDKGLDYAIFLANACRASLGIIHVIHFPQISSADHQTVDKVTQLLESAGKEILDKAEEEANSAGLKVERIQEFGYPANHIVDVANEGGYDLIIMGSRGMSGIKEFLLGSISHSVSHHAKCPVLIVH